MSTGMYHIRDDGTLIEMSQQPYDSEELLQTLLAKYPNLLAGEQMNQEQPRRWLFIAREVNVPADSAGAARWSLDHLFLDQDGIPTLVEVKRGTDTRIRREVVGQMLDYAANAVVYWPIEFMRMSFETACASQGDASEARLAATLGRNDPDAFWAQAQTNLQAGKIRLVFVADVIPPELQRIIEFLNMQLNPAEVLGVEIKQYLGQGQRTLIPRVIGHTAAASAAKGTTPSANRTWNEETFFEDLTARKPAEQVAAAREIYQWAQTNALRLWWGKGKRDGSCYCMLDLNRQPCWVVAVWSSGHVEIPFQYMMTAGPFADEAKRLDLLNRLNTIAGVQIPPQKITGSPYLQLGTFSDPEVLRQLLVTLSWVVKEIRTSGRGEAP